MNIREMRTRLGDTQSEFAARYSIPFRTVQNWETGLRKPPEYILSLLEDRIREDLVNRKTASLPKYDPRKKELPKRSDYVGALSWLKAVRERLGEEVVFALDEALMCQGSCGGRSTSPAPPPLPRGTDRLPHAFRRPAARRGSRKRRPSAVRPPPG